MTDRFQLAAPYQPAGDQPQAIQRLAEGFEAGLAAQTLLGVTGSGKTYTIANVIERIQRPTIVMAPNKTLAAQLYGEFKEFFPHNAVEYFVSYYDYYQPERAAAFALRRPRRPVRRPQHSRRALVVVEGDRHLGDAARAGCGRAAGHGVEKVSLAPPLRQRGC